MNRRELLSVIPSLTIGSVVPVGMDMREQYMRYIFPSNYNIQSCESEGVKHYDAMYIDSERGIQYHYYWDTKHREHRTRIKVYGEDPLDINSVVEGESESIVEAKEELEKHFVEHIFHEDRYNIIRSEVGGVTYHTASDTTYDEKVVEYSYDPYNDRHCYRYHDFTTVPVHTELGYADSAVQAKQILEGHI